MNRTNTSSFVNSSAAHQRDEIIKLAPPSASIVAIAPFHDDTCGSRLVPFVVAIHVICNHGRNDEKEEKNDDDRGGSFANVRIVQRGRVDGTRRTRNANNAIIIS